MRSKRLKRLKTWASAAALCGGLLLGVAQASVLTLNTGVDSGNSVLAAGTLDPYWQISVNGSSFSSARVAYPGAYPDYSSGQTCCGMETVANTAAWVTTPGVTATSPTTDWGIYNMVYLRRTFDLSGYDLATVALTEIWRVADYSFGIYINGNLIAGTNFSYSTTTFATDQAFSLVAGSSFFTSGMNTIELRGQSVNSVWDAF